MQYEQENLSYSLYVTDIVYEKLMEVLIEQELVLTDFLRSILFEVYLKKSDIYEGEGITFEYVFEVNDEDLIIEVPINQSVCIAHYATHALEFRDLEQLKQILRKVLV